MGVVNPGFHIVIPVHNGASLLPDLLRSLNDLSAPSAQIVLVDDGSSDESWEIISGSSGIQGIKLDKNRGQQSAILAALTICRDQTVITMDDDLSHPLQTIPLLLRAIEDGADLAYARPPRRPGSPLRRLSSRMHQIHMSRLTGSPFSLRVGSYRALSPNVVNRILSAPLSLPYLSAQALSLRPAPSAVMVDCPPFTPGNHGRFSLLSLLKMEYRLAAAYGCWNRTPQGANAGEIAGSWIAGVSDR